MAKPKYKSRATRCAEAAGNISMAAEEIRGIADELTTLLDDYDSDHEGATVVDAETSIEVLEIIAPVPGQFESADESKGEIENLSEEMGNWRDNMQGTNLESTDKYSRVDEAASTLEDASSNLDGVSEPEAPKKAEDGTMDIEALRDYVTELENTAQELEDAASDAENVEFPGMFG
jgi:hypothetical protein